MHGANCPAESLNMHYSQPQFWVPSFYRISLEPLHWHSLEAPLYIGKGGATPKVFHTTVLAQTSDFHLAFVPASVVASSRPLIISYYSVDLHACLVNASYSDCSLNSGIVLVFLNGAIETGYWEQGYHLSTEINLYVSWYHSAGNNKGSKLNSYTKNIKIH